MVVEISTTTTTSTRLPLDDNKTADTDTPADHSVSRDSKNQLPSHIVHSLKETHQLDILSAHPCPSAQQRVWIVHVEPYHHHRQKKLEGADEEEEESTSALWRNCLLQGQNRIVIREWRGGCQWWDLHRNHSIQTLASAELRGYRWARKTTTMMMMKMSRGRQSSTKKNNKNDDNEYGGSSHAIVIPRILYSEIDPIFPKNFPQREEEEDSTSSNWYPWAILEYVGPQSLYFQNKNNRSDDERGKIFDRTWVEGMIPIRQEFGFDEPHPRWGRIPEYQALEYAMMILDQIIIPFHNVWKEMERFNPTSDSSSIDWKDWETSIPATPTFTYETMVVRYQQAYQDVTKHWVRQQYHGTEDVMDKEMKHHFNKVLDLMKDAVENVLPCVLRDNAIPTIIPYRTLVHMDLQAQNIFFLKDSEHSLSSVVHSLLDWEDAAIADPRFELLLMGRKVCANRDQAERIWNHYAERTQQHLGPLLPWLRLESIHSLLTMVLQSRNMLNGGRNPWESSKDIIEKMEREIDRWNEMLANET